MNKYEMIGHLQALWWWALDNADDDGNLALVFDEEIADAAGWPTKSATSFVSSLVRVGFLESNEDGESYRLHNWWQYAGKLNDLRKASSTRGSYGNHKRWHKDRNIVVPDCEFCLSLSDSLPDSGSDHRLASRTNLPHLTSPTNQPNLIPPPAGSPEKGHEGLSKRESLELRVLLELTPGEWNRVRPMFPDVDLNQRWREWREWIERDLAKRKPEDKVGAFIGFVRLGLEKEQA